MLNNAFRAQNFIPFKLPSPSINFCNNTLRNKKFRQFRSTELRGGRRPADSVILWELKYPLLNYLFLFCHLFIHTLKISCGCTLFSPRHRFSGVLTDYFFSHAGMFSCFVFLMKNVEKNSYHSGAMTRHISWIHST